MNIISESPSHLKRLRVHPILRDLGVTAVASLTSFIASLVLVAVVSRLFGVLLLGEYLLLRRLAAWLVPLANLGMGVGLPRFVAYSHRRFPERHPEYFIAAFVCTLACTCLLGITLCLIPRSIGLLLFGGAQFSRLSIPLFLLLLGSAAHVTIYGFYRGRLEMKRAAIIQLSIAVAPILSISALFWTHSVGLVTSAIGGLSFVIAIAFSIPLLSQVNRATMRKLPERATALLKYGILRVPGDMSTGALLAVGPVIAAHYLPLSEVTFLLVAGSVLAMVTISSEPLGLVFLSGISMLLAEGRREEVRTHLAHLVSATIDVSIFVTVQLIIFADVLLRGWLGAHSGPGAPIVRVISLGIPFYLFYTALRSAIDAGTVRPINARNTVLSLAALLVFISASVRLAPRSLLLQAIAFCIVLALATLAYCTARGLKEVFSLSIRWSDSFLPVCFALALGLVALTVRRLTTVSLPSLVGLELFLGFLYVIVCFLSGTRWLYFLSSLVNCRLRPAVDLAGHGR